MTLFASLSYLSYLFQSVSQSVRRAERGEVTEKVIITAVFAALAIAAGAIIVAKVMERANEVPTK